MISRVVIKNFKSIGEPGVDLELKPLTLLVGPNGGGKSSILEAIAVASQDNFNGRLVSFPSWQTLVHRLSDNTLLIDVYFDWHEKSNPPGFRRRYEPNGTPHEGGLLGVPNEESNALLANFRLNSFILSSVRGDVPYTTSTREAPKWVGVHGENLLMLLTIMFGRRLYEDIENKVVKWANRFGIDALKAGARGDNQSGSDYRDSELRAVLDLALSSSGSKQILTVITQLFWAPEGSLVMIEEPEISLHPGAQIDVLEMFGEAVKEDKQIIATTHSTFMLQALGYAVLKGWLTPDQMVVYHVEKGEKGTTATPLPLSEKGYIQDWVPSFTDVERRLLLEWAKTVPRE